MDDLKATIRTTRRDLSDLTVAVEESISEDDKIAYRWTMQGHYQGDHGGSSTTDQVIMFTGITMLPLRRQGDRRPIQIIKGQP